MNKDISGLRESLIAEAKSSPMLLSDLAGLEAYVSESYNSRSFIELLQNADDAKATKFYVKRSGEYLFVANNGRPFNIKDLESQFLYSQLLFLLLCWMMHYGKGFLNPLY